MTNVTAWSEKSLRNNIKICILDGSLKGMLGVMAMIIAKMTWEAKIKVRARCASNKLVLGKFWGS